MVPHGRYVDLVHSRTASLEERDFYSAGAPRRVAVEDIVQHGRSSLRVKGTTRGRDKTHNTDTHKTTSTLWGRRNQAYFENAREIHRAYSESDNGAETTLAKIATAHERTVLIVVVEQGITSLRQFMGKKCWPGSLQRRGSRLPLGG